ncbi:MAG: transcriptional repressor [Candidatus Omnitrophica bacterium]|nr:transcriptional repressor [Candidatus Omnitrophota bacterium]
MEKRVEILKKHNIRITPQRLGVYEILLDKNKHLTAEAIYRKIRVSFPTISLATVYSILELYYKKHLLNEIRIDFDKSCFDIRTDTHHHFLCKQCAEIYDIDLHPCSALNNKEVDGHLIHELQGYFYGICSKCKDKSNL